MSSTFKDTVIVSCGPSIGKINLTKLNEFCKDKNIICVKQSHSLISHKKNIILNNIRMEKLIEKGEDTIYSVTWKDNDDSKYLKKISDYNFGVRSGFRNIKHLILNDEDLFKKINLNLECKNIVRGPGLVTELAIPISLKFNSKNIYIFGWDIYSYNKGYQHYYSKKNTECADVDEAHVVSQYYIDYLFENKITKNKQINIVSDLNKIRSKSVINIHMDDFNKGDI